MIEINRQILAGVEVQAAVVAFTAVDKKFMFTHGTAFIFAVVFVVRFVLSNLTQYPLRPASLALALRNASGFYLILDPFRKQIRMPSVFRRGDL